MKEEGRVQRRRAAPRVFLFLMEIAVWIQEADGRAQRRRRADQRSEAQGSASR